MMPKLLSVSLKNKVDPLGFEPRAFRMQSERDTTTPRAQFEYWYAVIMYISAIHTARYALCGELAMLKWSHAGSNRGPYGY
jgi:hypothetical protein